MQIENDYDKEVYNGDLGVVSRIDMEEGELTVDFDGRDLTYGFGELDELVLAYATTIHKSQGSEYPAVVIPLSTQHYPMLQRNLVYTGVTRGKRLVVLVGQRKALAIAVKGARTRRRWSKLREWLIGCDTPSELKVTPHVAQNTTNRRSAIDRRTTRHPGYAVSGRLRKRVEEVFGWTKAAAGFRKTHHRGLARVGWMFTLTAMAYNLVRLTKLVQAEA
jgi:hypothetical protein